MIFNCELIELIDNFLDAIFPLPCNFGSTIGCGADDDPVISVIKENLWYVDPYVTVDYGASKLVIMSPKLNNLVIKIPFNGYYLSEDEDNEWIDFEAAPGPDETDYCFAEWCKYQDLEALNLDCFVSKIYFYKEYCGTRIFLQEFAIPMNVDIDAREPSQKSKTIAKTWKDEGRFRGCKEINVEWIACCLDTYGKAKTEKFLNYCKTVDMDILADAHDANFGYRLNGTPCIFDFSGFLD